VKNIREQDTDWRSWLMNKPFRPFDPQLYFEFRLYREFSSGIPDQWMSHGIDLCHYFIDESFPESVVANGGIFAWHDGRENPDTFQALFTYPKGFLVSYSTSLAMMHPALRGSWERKPPWSTTEARAVRDGRWWKRREITNKTPVLIASEL
jgi:hypothetical protein